MYPFKIFTLLVLLFTTPTLLLYPQNPHPAHLFKTKKIKGKIPAQLDQEQENISSFLSYDKIVHLLNEIEFEELENRCSPEDLKRINRFLALLAKEGFLFEESNEALTLEEDIQELLDGDSYTCSLWVDGKDILTPAVFNPHKEMFLCKGFFKKTLGKSKKFIKTYKKEIIIGTIVVLAATVIVVAVVAASSAGAAAMSAAAAAASSGLDKIEKPPSESKESSSSIDLGASLDAINETPLLKAAIVESLSSFQAFAEEDVVFQSLDFSQIQRDLSFGEKVKNLGSILAHETLEGISEIASMIPQLGEELKELSSQMIPQRMLQSNQGALEDLTGNYENLFGKGHQVIDELFSTQHSDYYASSVNFILFNSYK